MAPRAIPATTSVQSIAWKSLPSGAGASAGKDWQLLLASLGLQPTASQLEVAASRISSSSEPCVLQKS